MPSPAIARRLRRTPEIKLWGAKVSFRLENKQGQPPDWIPQLENFDRKADNMQPVFEWFGAYMIRSTQRTIIAQGRPDAFAPLAPSTIADRLRQGYGATPILIRAGDMFRGFRYTATRRGLTFSNTQFYTWYHQYGTTKMPRRVMLRILRQDKSQFTRKVREHLRG